MRSPESDERGILETTWNDAGGRAVRRWGAALTASAAAVAITLPAATAQAADGPAGIGAKGAYLLDSGANRPLWSRAADTRRQMASTTKIMTAVVVLDGHAADLDKQITVKQAYRDWVADHAASTADLRTGDKLTVRQLLYGLMLPSGCDAAYALADTFGSGDTEEERAESFIGKMNEKGRRTGPAQYPLRFVRRNFRARRQLHHAARPGAAFPARARKRHIRHRDEVDERRAEGEERRPHLHLVQHQQAAGFLPGRDRHQDRLDASRRPCLTFAARRGGRTVVGVILNDPTGRYPDAAKMLDYAFRTRTPMKLRQLPFGAHED
ncbi:serine hydrolase [Streptomyces olivoverticillatus]